MEVIEISSEFIKLDQFLKYIGEAPTGAFAKEEIQSGQVMVNGELETRRGKKLRPGDIVSYEGQDYQVK